MRTFRVESCHEAWERMAPAEGGRHCEACSRVVLDARSLRRAEFEAHFDVSRAHLCARVRVGRDGRPRFVDDPTAAPARSGLLAVAAVGLALVQPNVADGQEPPVPPRSACVPAEDGRCLPESAAPRTPDAFPVPPEEVVPSVWEELPELGGVMVEEPRRFVRRHERRMRREERRERRRGGSEA